MADVTGAPAQLAAAPRPGSPPASVAGAPAGAAAPALPAHAEGGLSATGLGVPAALPPLSPAGGGSASLSGLGDATPTLPSQAFSPGPLAAGLVLALLAAAAFVLARRRRGVPRLVEILESASLGPKRSLVVARLGGEILLLGSSEGGISLLSSRPAEGLVPAPAPKPVSAPADSRRADEPGPRATLAASHATELDPPSGLRGLLHRAAARAGLLARGSRGRPAPPAAEAGRRAGFESLLAESVEDVELRRKLAAGGVGHVR